jgi:hypothetical protein
VLAHIAVPNPHPLTRREGAGVDAIHGALQPHPMCGTRCRKGGQGDVMPDVRQLTFDG